MSDIAFHLKNAAGFGRKIEKAWLVVVAIFLGLAIFLPLQAEASLSFVAEAFSGMAPFLVVAIVAAAYARATGADNLIARVFQGHMSAMIVLAALFGGLSPFCSCGVIPLIAALLAMGVPVPAVMAFWLASPLMDPAMFVLTVGTLGVDFAVAKTMAAIGIGMIGGFTTAALMARGAFASPLREGVGGCGGCGTPTIDPNAEVVWKFWKEGDRRQKFCKESGWTGLFLLKWLTLAFLLESLMIVYISAEQIAAVLGQGNAWAIPLATIVGVPAYLNGYAALPLVAGLIELGTAPGAGMAFLIAGGVTSIPAAIAVYALVHKPLFLCYIALSLTGGMLSGVLFQIYAGLT
ncbi:MAG: permease [Candidatus Latescibacterota bacterium]